MLVRGCCKKWTCILCVIGRFMHKPSHILTTSLALTAILFVKTSICLKLIGILLHLLNHQMIKEPTQIGNILGLVLINSLEQIDNLCVHNCTYLSDHSLISASVMVDTINSCPKEKLSSHSVNLDYIQESQLGRSIKLSTRHWLWKVLSSTENETGWHMILSTILEGCSKYIPRWQKSIQQYPVW